MKLKVCCCVSKFCSRNFSGLILDAAVPSGYLKYDHRGHSLFAVEDSFHVDIEQIREGLAVFGVSSWENGLPEPEYDDGPFCNEGQTDMWGWDL